MLVKSNLTGNISVISIYVSFMCISVCEFISITYPLGLFLKASFQSESVWEEFTIRLKYPYLFNMCPNVYRIVQTHIDRDFFNNFEIVLLFWSPGGKQSRWLQEVQLFWVWCISEWHNCQNTIFSELFV